MPEAIMEQCDTPVLGDINIARSAKCLLRIDDLLVTCFGQQAPDIVRGSKLGINDVLHAGLSRLANASK